MITMELLLESFFDCSKSKKSSHDYIEFNQDRSKNLKDLLDEINNRNIQYHHILLLLFLNQSLEKYFQQHLETE